MLVPFVHSCRAHQVVMVSLAHLVFEERRETPEKEALLVTQETEVVR